MNTFEIITSGLLGIFTAIFLEYFLKFRPGLAEKFVLKEDCRMTSSQIHNENRQDHQEIFRKLDELNKTQTLILQELGKKADRS